MNIQIKRLAIFIGGMRCGSTAINDYLKQHPQVCVHSRKDPHFFSGNDDWDRGWVEYMGGWSDFEPGKHRIVFESSTHYTKYPLYKQTAERMASSPFDMRLIYGVQDPLARVESHFVHNAGKGYLDPNDSNERRKLLEQAVNVSNYDLQIKRYERFFSQDQLIVFRTRDLISNPSDVLNSICHFLGVDPEFKFQKIPRRPRRFRMDFSAAALTEEERNLAAEKLREPISMFEQRYAINIWDGQR